MRIQKNKLNLANILLEDFSLQNDRDLESPLVFSFGRKRLDHFFINWIGNKLTKSIGGVKVYFGLIPNQPVRDLQSQDLDIIFDRLKKEENISQEDIQRVVVGAGPHKVPYDFIISIPSSGKLNTTVSGIFRRLNPNKTCRVLSLEKALYTVDAMVDPDKYNKADDTTKRMVDTWVKRLIQVYGIEKLLPIKVSPDKTNNHPGLQSGGRGLLRNKFKQDLPQQIYKGLNILVVDDNLVSGDTLRQAFELLQSKGVAKQNITGYVFATKTIPEGYMNQLKTDLTDPEKYRL